VGPATFRDLSLLPPDETDRAPIADALGPTPVEIDDIVRPTGLTPAAVYLVLLRAFPHFFESGQIPESTLF
jgi:predicted Rossmann fold nucleotide-binding protein DprA/Smf involved in DNA uptake